MALVKPLGLSGARLRQAYGAAGPRPTNLDWRQLRGLDREIPGS
jgi:hypothetical protein